MRATIRDPDGGLLIAQEDRTVRLSQRNAGWAEPDLVGQTDFANVPACPPHGHALLDRLLWLDVSVDDGASRATLRRTIVPSCHGDAQCVGTCAEREEVPAFDAGTPDPSAP